MLSPNLSVFCLTIPAPAAGKMEAPYCVPHVQMSRTVRFSDSSFFPCYTSILWSLLWTFRFLLRIRLQNKLIRMQRRSSWRKRMIMQPICLYFAGVFFQKPYHSSLLTISNLKFVQAVESWWLFSKPCIRLPSTGPVQTIERWFEIVLTNSVVPSLWLCFNGIVISVVCVFCARCFLVKNVAEGFRPVLMSQRDHVTFLCQAWQAWACFLAFLQHACSQTGVSRCAMQPWRSLPPSQPAPLMRQCVMSPQVLQTMKHCRILLCPPTLVTAYFCWEHKLQVARISSCYTHSRLLPLVLCAILVI